MQVFIKQEGNVEVKCEWIHLESMLPTRLPCDVLVRHLYLSFEEVNVDIDGDLFPLQLLCNLYLPTLGAVYVMICLITLFSGMSIKFCSCYRPIVVTL